jgi:hypothetical protein
LYGVKREGKVTMNVEAYFKVQHRYSPVEIHENHGNVQSGWPVTQPIFEAGTFQIQSQNVIFTPT